MKKIALLTCKEIDPNSCNDDQLIIPPLEKEGYKVSFEVWNDSNVDWTKYTHLIIRSTWDYTDNIKAFLSFLSERSTHLQIFNDLEVVKINYDKTYLKKIKDLGFEIVPTHFSTISKEILSKCFEQFNVEKLVVKPTIGAGASGLNVYSKSDLESIKDCSENYLIQPFLKSIQTDGEVSLIFFNDTFSHAITKLPKKGDFRSQEEFGSNITEFKPDKETLAYATDLLRKFSPNQLYSRVDLLKNNSGDWRLVGEIELIEPALYLSYSEESIQNFLREITCKLLK
jgi:hypothetical protein